MNAQLTASGYCQGCPYADVSIETVNLFLDGLINRTETSLHCSHERACERMFRKFGEEDKQ